MELFGLKSIIEVNKYKSYKGEQGKITSNILEFNFKYSNESKIGNRYNLV